MEQIDSIKELGEAKTGFIQNLSAFTQEEFNTIPFSGSWTAAQVGEHIFLSSSGLMETICAPAKSTERDPGEKINALREIFLNFEIKMVSPEFVLPSQTDHDKDMLLYQLDDTMTSLMAKAEPLNLSETSLGNVPPGMGEFTRIELLYFIIFHTRRHQHQLKNIFQKLHHR